MNRTALQDTTWTRVQDFGLIRMYQGSTGCRAAVSNEIGLLHISVAAKGRYPTWDELASARDAFSEPGQRFRRDFPPADEYVNVHETCLHLWEVQ